MTGTGLVVAQRIRIWFIPLTLALSRAGERGFLGGVTLAM